MARAQIIPLSLLALLALVSGFLEYGPARGPDPGSRLFVAHAVASLTLVFAWFRADARRRAYQASFPLKIAALILPVIALPWYFFRSRGLIGGLKALGWSVLAFAGIMAAYHLGSLLA